MDEERFEDFEEGFEDIDINSLNWWQRFKMSKVGRFIERHGDAIAIGIGGTCALAGVVVAHRDGNAAVYTTTEDGSVYRLKAKKMKSVSTRKIMNKTMIESKE